MRSGLVSLTTARPVNTAQPRTIVNGARPMINVFNKAHSTVRRPINNKTTSKNSNFNQKVNTARPKAVLNAVKGNQGNPQQDLQEKGVIDSGCSRHMTRNMSYLTDFEEIDGGYVAFGDEAVYKELDDSLVRATTTASSLEAEQDSGNINKTQSKARPNEAGSQGATSGGVLDDEMIVDNEDVVKTAKSVSVVGENINAASVEVSVAATTVSAASEIPTVTIADELTLAQALAELKSAKPITQGIAFRNSGKSTTTTTTISSKDKGKAEFNEEERLAREKDEANVALTKEWDDIQAKIKADHFFSERLQKLFDNKMKRVNTFVDLRTQLVESSSKRVGTELEQEVTKKQKVDDVQETAKVDKDKETTKLQSLMEVVPDEEEVIIEAIPLATKPPSIVEWKIHKGLTSYYQITRADGSFKVYLVFSQLLKSFDREDLETLWRLVKAKHGPKAVVNAVRPKAVVNAVKGNSFNVVKASACWVWRPKQKVLDHGNPQQDLHETRVIDSGCSRHMIGNMSYLTNFEEIDRGYVAFGGNPKGRKITGRGTKACDDAGKARMETVLGKDYILLPFIDLADLHSLKVQRVIPDAGFITLRDDERSTIASDYTVCSHDNTVGSNICQCYDDEDVSVEPDMNNLDAFMPISPIPTTRIHKDHLLDQDKIERRGQDCKHTNRTQLGPAAKDWKDGEEWDIH
ncbi:hypothetical protein Tco_0371115 [Tanacetum coccineum]